MSRQKTSKEQKRLIDALDCCLVRFCERVERNEFGFCDELPPRTLIGELVMLTSLAEKACALAEKEYHE